MTKRTIKPHKGNRTKRIEVRATVETVAQIAAIIAARGDARYTVADWVAEKAREDAAKILDATQK